MKGISILEIINLQLENIKNNKNTQDELALELAILKSFVINQDLLPEIEEFRNLIFMELDKN
jgi:hypothetical protein